jgi:signal transduction histidine kinase
MDARLDLSSHNAGVDWLISTRQRLDRVPTFAWDALLAAVLTVAAQTGGQFSSNGWERIAALGLTIPLAWRRRRPLLAFCIVSVAILAVGHRAPYAAVAAGTIASYSVGLYSRRRWISFGAVVLSATLVVIVIGGGLPPLPDSSTPFLILIPVWLVGNAFRVRELRVDLIEARQRHLEQQHEQARQSSILAERGRIARELHDVVAHGVSVMVVQAGAARELLKRTPHAPAEVTESLLAVEASGRAALTELRHMLGALNSDATDTSIECEVDASSVGGIAPQPGLEQLGTLVERVRDAGLPVTMNIVGEARSLSAGTSIAAYRIIQESLTNALRYAGRAQTNVSLEYRQTELKIEILDEGVETVPSNHAPGHGLAGMRERVAVFGGRVETGPRLERGYAVRAWLPLEVPTQ